VPGLVGDRDAFRLERVLGNLLSNAVKYNPQGGEVAVRVAREDGPGGPWLAGAKQIVAQHGGAIDVESVEGEGSTLTVRLPLGDAPSA